MSPRKKASTEEEPAQLAETGEETVLALEKPKRGASRRRKTQRTAPPTDQTESQAEEAPESAENTPPRPPQAELAPPLAILLEGGPALAFEVAGQRYGLPVKNIVQIIEMVSITRIPKAPKIVVGVVDFRGQVIPIVDMRRRLELPVRPYTLYTPILVSQLDGRRVGLVVDSVSEVIDLQPGQIEVPDQIFTTDMALEVHHLVGIARLSDGLLILLDPRAFLSAEEEETLAAIIPEPQE